VKLSTSTRQDAKLKRELLKTRSVELKLKHYDNDAIAKQLYQEGLGVESEGTLTKPYSGPYIGKIVKEAMREIAADRGDHGKLLQLELEQELQDLITAWRPAALGEAVDSEGNPLPMSVKAADFVRKAVADLATLGGANEPVKVQVQIQVDSALDQFISTLRQLMPEDHFQSVITAIDTATAMNSEYWQSQQKQIEGETDIIDAQVIE
jgi:hypothetical protein